jgi:hypothetical protein
MTKEAQLLQKELAKIFTSDIKNAIFLPVLKIFNKDNSKAPRFAPRAHSSKPVVECVMKIVPWLVQE